MWPLRREVQFQVSMLLVRLLSWPCQQNLRENLFVAAPIAELGLTDRRDHWRYCSRRASAASQDTTKGFARFFRSLPRKRILDRWEALCSSSAALESRNQSPTP